MPVDVEKAVGARLEPSSFSWEERDVILYHLGIGSGGNPVDPDELRYTYEADLVVMPTYATIPPFSTMMMGMAAADGVDVNLAQILHGEQAVTVHGTIPTSGSVDSEGSIVDVYDKGSGAVVVLEIISTLRGSAEPLFTNLSSFFVKGEGGFGGDPGPSETHRTPDRAPDHVVQTSTLPQQALLYRMTSGDLNPLHVDPGFAAFAGYERPILHGLCTFGIVCRAIVRDCLSDDPSVVASYQARFAGVVYPGESIVTRMWEGDDGIVAEVSTAERGEPVLTNTRVRVRE